MSPLLKVLIFLLSNTLGFTMGALAVTFGMKLGIIDTTSPDFDVATFANMYFPRIIVTWIVCALFSFSYFFVKSSWKFVFLLAPIIIPFIYGITLLTHFS